MSPEIEDKILQEMAASSIFCKSTPLIPNGSIVRFKNNNVGNPNCWYGIHVHHHKGENFYVAIFGNWKKSSGYDVWRSNNYVTLSNKDKRILDQKVKESAEKAKAKLLAIHEEKAKEAAEDWHGFSTEGESQYLRKKQVGAYGIRFGSDQFGKFIAIPVCDFQKMWSYQKIYDRADGNNKWFMKDGRTKGCFYIIGSGSFEESDSILVCEGYATGATLYEASNIPTVIAFNSGNLDPVISQIRKKYPFKRPIICADNDCWSPQNGNPGKEKADECGRKYSCAVMFPDFSGIDQTLLNERRPTDFCDLRLILGEISEKY